MVTNLANGLIKLSKSPPDVSILFVSKPNGSLRLCVDYQGLNDLTIKNWNLLPLIDESVDWLEKAKHFTKLDLTSAYHRMQIWEGDEWKTAFQTRYSDYNYQVVLFGLSNASATLQGYINKIQAKKLDVFMIIYLEHILSFTDKADHVDYV